mmetsp:Transcript_29362/g.82802  ORF Transcript_29362/g.82802 Transcript_29362/m.82802 type:complete len:236 (-) Transcript_29362:255-962(-)|eukprot:CAMPEP_0117663898 /NCGR_PEP_ID=MMETSP0804-20121206/8879_1 /TAXON_ID=1074897 /ORGANISM="Tetraselmis astigmatica, Strain CCMP880" /LENGTH=235 /DNA_ID=CAMNT_0005470989 /DNA_START=149 /DNA_END=856 /DNA_ORIENTATION=-
MGSSESTPLKFGYWKIRGLAAPARMMMEYAGVEYEDVQYTDGAKWFKEDKPEILKKNPMANLPYLVDGDTVICQSNSIYQYLGDKLALTPKDPTTKLWDSQVLHEVFDIRNNMIALVYPFAKRCRDDTEFCHQRTEILEKTLPSSYTKLEATLEMLPGPFVGGKKPAPSDFHLFEMIDQHEKLAESCKSPSPVAAFPKLSAFYKAFRELPQMKKYFESEAYALPINNQLGNAYFF